MTMDGVFALLKTSTVRLPACISLLAVGAATIWALAAEPWKYTMANEYPYSGMQRSPARLKSIS